MRRAEIIAQLKQIEPALRAFGVGGLFLFGSHARDAAGPTSDIDVFVDPANETTFDFVRYMDAYEALKDVVGESLDYGTRNGLHPLMRSNIEREAVKVF